MRTLVVAATFTISLSGCESVLVVPANEDVSAEASRLLSTADIHEIERIAVAVAPRKDIHSIHATSSDQVSVECGDPYRQNAQMISFTVHRRNGRWVADRKSIGTYSPIIVD